MDKTYEMFWDCEYCGSKKLLGKTHRFCPGCGVPQSPEKRYYPPDDDKVAVEDHEYVGADRLCPACDSAMSAKATHCTQCGSPMDGSAEARPVTDAKPKVPAPPPPKRGCLGKSLVFGCLGAILMVGLSTVLCKKETYATALGHSWERVVHVEGFGPAKDSAWCDEMPRGAFSVSRRRDVRSHRRVEDGQDCRTVRIDNADGTFREQQKCTPRHRQEPIYDERCDFTVNRWTRTRSARTAGAGVTPNVAWPPLSLRAGDCQGCEREGTREEHYRLRFKTSDGKTFQCEFDEAKWRSIPDGSRWRVKVGSLTGGASCNSLAPYTAESP